MKIYQRPAIYVRRMDLGEGLLTVTIIHQGSGEPGGAKENFFYDDENDDSLGDDNPWDNVHNYEPWQQSF